MNERVVQFGRRLDQVGILCQPAPEDADPYRPAIVMWNVGVNHRVGPFRVYVDLARALAQAGFTTFRFDSSGLGDSDVRREAVSDIERENADVCEALDLVAKRTNAQTFVLVGFCSSVDAAHRVAVKDARVVGAVHIEGYAFRTAGFNRRLPLRLLEAVRWRRFFNHPEHRLGRLLARVSDRFSAPPGEPVFKRDYPAWPAFTKDLETLTKRATSLLFVYSGGDTNFNHLEQFWEMFDSPRIDKRMVEVSYHTNADHTFYGLAVREALIARIVRWARARYPVSTMEKSALIPLRSACGE